MTFVRKTHEEITDLILSQITKGIVHERHEYRSNKVKYPLAVRTAGESWRGKVRDICRIDGTVNNGPHTFAKETDYRLSGISVEWLPGGVRPDENSPFFVNYRVDTRRGITDINPGSVVRTIVESVAREMDFINAQMNQVYNSAFIDTATGKSLDLVASLLGINRIMAGKASGEVTFFRDRAPDETEELRERIAFTGENRYLLKNPSVKAVKKVEGTVEGRPVVFSADADYTVSDGSIVWTPGGRQPDRGSKFSAEYSAYRLAVPAGTRVSTESRRLATPKVYRTTKDTPFLKNAGGAWEAVAPVEALNPGKDENVYAGELTVMPRPPLGAERVRNTKDIQNGTDPETDAELRERAKTALEMAGKGTLASLHSAVQGIRGVEPGGVKVVDQPLGDPGFVQVIVIGGDDEEIRRVIKETRAAGITVDFIRPQDVPLDIRLTLFVIEGLDHEELRGQADKAIRDYIASLRIDDDVILNQIIKAALNIPGVRDVREATINDQKQNCPIRTNERARLRLLEIFVEE